MMKVDDDAENVYHGEVDVTTYNNTVPLQAENPYHGAVEVTAYNDPDPLHRTCIMGMWMSRLIQMMFQLLLRQDSDINGFIFPSGLRLLIRIFFLCEFSCRY